jgi:hypothetical protein
MSTVIKTEQRRRSPLGQFVKWGFVAFNLLMVLWLVHGIDAVSQVTADSDAARAGKAIGATIGFSLILGIWVVGDIILGLFVLLTRGEKVLVEKTMGVTSRSGEPPPSGMDADVMIARYLERKQAEEAPRPPPVRPATPTFGRRR